jgi:hypothetical protein
VGQQRPTALPPSFKQSLFLGVETVELAEILVVMEALVVVLEEETALLALESGELVALVLTAEEVSSRVLLAEEEVLVKLEAETTITAGAVALGEMVLHPQ